MSTLQRLWNVLRGNRLDRELRDELATHVAMLEEEERSRGAGINEARYEARRRFGNPTAYCERTRDTNLVAWLDSFLQDLRFAGRQLRRSPGFTVTAVLLLALGIGLNAAIFALINSVILRALPLPEPDRLVVMLETEPAGCCSPPSWLDQRDIREQSRAFQSLAAYAFTYDFLLRLGDRSMRLRGGYVTSDYFRTLGVEPVMGRVFNAAEEQTARDNVVLIREDFWRNRLNGDPGILNKTLVVNGKKCNVIGVLPSRFRFPVDDAVIWAPLVPDKEAAAERGWHGFPMVGRLKPGVSFAQGRADFDRIMRRLARQYAADDSRGGTLFKLRDWQIGDNVRERLLVLQIAALALFLMACANVSSLLLARYSARRREFAIRGALGASRLRQIRQHVTESVLLVMLGAIAAAGVAWGGVRLLLHLYGDLMPRAAEISPDWRLVGITLAIAFAGALALGFTTALHESAKELEGSIRESNRSTGSHRSVMTRRALVVLQITCAVALLGGAGELFQSIWTLLHVNVGIDPHHLLTMHVTIPQSKYTTGPEIARFYNTTVARLRTLPGMHDVAAINMLPVEEMGNNGDVKVQGLPPHSNSFFAEYRWIAGDYFRTMRIPLLRGRFFLPEETSGAQRAVIINETMSRALWGTKNPLGSHITTESPEWATVVGVVRDVRQSGLAEPPRAELFYPAKLFADPFTSWSLVIRSSETPAELVPVIRHELRSLDPDAVVYSVRTMDEVLADSVSYQRIVALLVGCFSVLALLLAALGIYGVVSYVVEERAPEFAIRSALGAGPKKLVRIVAGQGIWMVATGLALGAAALLPLNILLAKFLYGVHRLNAAALVAMLFLLLLTGLLAIFVPALRAARIDPMRVLRQE
jgi:putative ABC transport system permease protein